MFKQVLWFALILIIVPRTLSQQNEFPYYTNPDFTLDVGSPVSDIAYSPDNSILISASEAGVTFWNTSTGELLRTLPTEAAVHRLAFTSDGSRIVAAVGQSQLVVWNINFNYEVEVIDFQSEIIDFAIAPDANTLALILDSQQEGDYSRVIVMTDLTSLRSGNLQLRELNIDKLGDWSDLAFDPSGRYLAAGVWHPMPNTGYEIPEEASIYVWEIGQNTSPRRYYAGFPSPITEVEFSPDSSFLLASSNDLLGWKIEEEELTYLTFGGVNETGLAIGGKLAASAQMVFVPASELERGRTTVNLRDWTTGKTLAVFHREGPALESGGFSGGPYSLTKVPVKINTNGTQLATVDPGGVISLWNLNGLSEPETEPDARIFAYCDELGSPLPVVTADQPVTIIWSWFATTIPQIWDHRAAAKYEVTLDGEPVTAVFIENPIQRDPANDHHWTLYYGAAVGTLAPGTHLVTYRVTWRQPISDGLDAFGPGTTQEENTGQCQFTVR